MTAPRKPICCYCDNDLCCAHCGREQPDDSEQPPAAPVEIPGLTIDAIHKQALRMHPADQHKLAEMIAANVGYELTPEPPHPDCPHERSSAATGQADVLAHLRVTFRQHGIDAALEDAAEEIARLRAVPQEAFNREALAHIIDPTAKFKDIEGVTWSKFEIQRRDLAYSKADAILALSRPERAKMPPRPECK